MRYSRVFVSVCMSTAVLVSAAPGIIYSTPTPAVALPTVPSRTSSLDSGTEDPSARDTVENEAEPSRLLITTNESQVKIDDPASPPLSSSEELDSQSVTTTPAQKSRRAQKRDRQNFNKKLAASITPPDSVVAPDLGAQGVEPTKRPKGARRGRSQGLHEEAAASTIPPVVAQDLQDEVPPELKSQTQHVDQEEPRKVTRASTRRAIKDLDRLLEQDRRGRRKWHREDIYE